jgi:hypothetical protein
MSLVGHSSSHFGVLNSLQGSAKETDVLEQLLASTEARADARSADVAQLQGAEKSCCRVCASANMGTAVSFYCTMHITYMLYVMLHFPAWP